LKAGDIVVDMFGLGEAHFGSVFLFPYAGCGMSTNRGNAAEISIGL